MLLVVSERVSNKVITVFVIYTWAPLRVGEGAVHGHAETAVISQSVWSLRQSECVLPNSCAEVSPHRVMALGGGAFGR